MDATTATQSRQLGSLLVEKRLITAEQLEQALQQQESTGAWLGEVVVAEFGVSQVDLLQLLAEHMHDPVRARAAEPESPGRADFRLRRPIGEIFVELGFITSDQAGDVFFHIKDCRANEAELQPGLAVEFELGTGRKGVAAKDVTPLEVTHA